MVGKIFKIHVQNIRAMHRRELAVQRGRSWCCPAAAASTTSPGALTHPCAQAIIVNDKVTIEVIIVLN